MAEGCTPLEILSILERQDYDLAVRCLELIRSHLPTILPASRRYRVEVIPLCHHHPNNTYPAFGVFGPHTEAEFQDAERRIAAWIAERGRDWLIAESAGITTPSWKSLQAPSDRITAPDVAPDRDS